MTPGECRRLASEIADLRAMLVAGFIADATGRPERQRALGDVFDARVKGKLPLWLQVNGGLTRRVSEPASRRTKREGILAQAQRPRVRFWLAE